MRLASAVAACSAGSGPSAASRSCCSCSSAVTSLAVAAGPRLFNRVADEGLRYEAARATAVQRNVQFTSVDRLPARTRTTRSTRVVARGAALPARLAGLASRSLVDDEHYRRRFDPVPGRWTRRTSGPS